MPVVVEAAADTDKAVVIRHDFIAGAKRCAGDCCILPALRQYAAAHERCGVVLRHFHTDIDLVGKASQPLHITGSSDVIPVRHRLSDVAG